MTDGVYIWVCKQDCELEASKVYHFKAGQEYSTLFTSRGLSKIAIDGVRIITLTSWLINNFECTGRKYELDTNKA